MKRPLIGIIPLIDIERESYWMLPGYMKGIEEAGGIPVMLPLTSDRHAEKSEKCGECCLQRDEMETLLLPMVLEQDKPVLGICRGLQLINAALGGSLYQDLPTEHPSSICHRQPAPYDQPIHQVELVPDTPLQKCLEKDELPVNSCHHQGIKELASTLQPMAYAQDGLVEAVWKPGSRFVWAVQWHPEFSHKVDENSRKIFRDFVKAAAGDSIFGADGPTSVYIKGVTDREVSPRELEERALFKKKKEEIERSPYDRSGYPVYYRKISRKRTAWEYSYLSYTERIHQGSSDHPILSSASERGEYSFSGKYPIFGKHGSGGAESSS